MKTGILFLLLIFSNAIWSQQPRLVLPVGHTNLLSDAEFSPDGKRALTASMDNTIKIWDTENGYLLATLKKHTGGIIHAAFSPDGKKIVSVSMDSTSIIWDALTGQQLFKLVGHTNVVKNLAISTDNKKLATASCDSTVRIWDLATGKLIMLLAKHQACVVKIKFGADGKSLLSASLDSSVILWNVENGNILFKVNEIKGGVNFCDISPDGNLAVYSSSNIARILNLSTGLIIGTLTGHTGIIRTCKFSPDGRFVLTSSADSTARLWDIKNCQQLHVLDGHTDEVNKAELSKDGNIIITASFDRTVGIWDAHNGSFLGSLKGMHSGLIRIARFSQDNKRIITASDDNTAVIWDLLSEDWIVSLSGYSYNIEFGELNADGKYLVTGLTGNLAQLWSIENSNLVQTFNGHLWDVRTARFSNDGLRVVTASRDGTAKVYDVKTGNIVLNLEGHSEALRSAIFSPNGQLIVTTSSDKTAIIWDANTGKKLKKLEGHNSMILDARFSPDNKKLVTYGWENRAILWDVRSGKKRRIIKHSDIINSAVFSSDGSKLLTASWDNSAIIWDLNKPKHKIILNGHMDAVRMAVFSPDSKYILTASNDKTIKLWNTINGDLVATGDGHNGPVWAAGFSSDGTRIVSASADYNAKVWEVNSLRCIHTLIGHEGIVRKAVFHPDGKHILTISFDNTCKVWDLTTGVNQSTFLSTGVSGDFTIGNTGFYQCSPAVAKLLHYVTPDLKVITFEQLDVKYNRPDLVLRAIGNTDTNLIHSYKKAYDKRIKKLGIDTTQFGAGYSVPEADFENRDAIEYERKNNELLLKITGVDSSYKLDRFNIWVNEIPMFGQRGISLRNRNTNQLDTGISVHLSAGENRIETSILNVNGTESYRMPLYVKYIPEKKEIQKVYFVGLGMDQFQDTTYNLKYSSKDIRDLATALHKRYGDTLQIDTLFNEDLTVENLAKLKTKLLNTSVNDKVIVSYSGHGLLSQDYDYYLSTYNVDFENPEISGLPYEELENLLDSIPARQKLMLIDACHSGEVDKDEFAGMYAVADSMGLSKGSKVRNTTTKIPQLGLANSFELMQELFVNVSKGTGATVISASAGTQFALERGDLKNGVFTYCILEAMANHPTMTVSQLKEVVGKRVVELTHGLQKPTSRNETINSDWRVW